MIIDHRRPMRSPTQPQNPIARKPTKFAIAIRVATKPGLRFRNLEKFERPRL
jgi:hypothetical protein